MWPRLFFTLVLVCPLTTNPGLAQDATKVEPKHYRLAFENDQVQVVSIHYGPHERSAFHDHPAGVIVNITDGHLIFTDQGGSTQEIFSKRGEARWFPALRHKVENLGDLPYDGVYIAFKNPAGHSGVSPK